MQKTEGTGRFVYSTISSIVVSAIVSVYKDVSAIVSVYKDVSAIVPVYKDVSALVLFMLFYVLFLTILCINNHIEYKNKQTIEKNDIV